MVKAIVKKGWNSATIMSWMSYSTKTLTLFVALPLILKNFSAAEVSLWYLFSSITVLLGLADFGFRSTFSRIISFASGGAEDVGVYKDIQTNGSGNANWELIERINSSMKTIYFYLSIILLILLATLGTWSLVKPINLVEDRSGAWIGWGVIIVSTVMKFYGTIYQNYLEGLNKIALVRRIEAIMSLGGIITSIVVLLLGGDVLYLVIAVQLWAVLNVVRNWYLARIIEGGQYKKFKKQPFDKALFKKIWSPAWRSGISGVMSNGLTHLSGVLYAQIGSANIVAGYLLALRIITQIREVSMAPFYSKIPVMARLRVEGKNQGLIKIAQRGMFVSHLVFVLGVVVVAFFSQPLLKEINSNTLFVSNEFWMLLSFAFFVHRYGAMHMQLYLTTNHVMSHIADGVSGIIFMVVGFMSVRWLGLYAIPVGMLAGYLGFYAWFAAIYSYKSLNINFIDYEKHAVFFPLFIYCIHLILSCFFNN